jgi:hypothetical protein
MNDTRRSRVVLLLVLAVLGLSLAGVGSVLGVTQSLTPADTSAEFVVTSDEITVDGGGGERTLVANMTDVRDVSIAASNDGHFTVETTETPSLTAADRSRAKAIARENDTVQAVIGRLAEYRVTVDPVERISASSLQTESLNLSDARRTGDGSTFVVRTNETATGDYDAVWIHREPTYVEDRATVRMYRPGGGGDALRYAVDVDLANGTVTDLTDWERSREAAETITVSADGTRRTEATATADEE